MPAEWDVGRPGEACGACGRAFEVNERYFSALFDRESAFERRDFCAACWAGKSPEAFSFWQTRRPEPDAERRLLVDDDVILNFFHRLDGQPEPLKVNLRYIVALILMRKRILKFETSQREQETDYLVLRLVRDKTHHRVVNPHLTDEEIERLSEEVGQLLNAEV